MHGGTEENNLNTCHVSALADVRSTSFLISHTFGNQICHVSFHCNHMLANTVSVAGEPGSDDHEAPAFPRRSSLTPLPSSVKVHIYSTSTGLSKVFQPYWYCPRVSTSPDFPQQHPSSPVVTFLRIGETIVIVTSGIIRCTRCLSSTKSPLAPSSESRLYSQFLLKSCYVPEACGHNDDKCHTGVFFASMGLGYGGQVKLQFVKRRL